LGGLVPVPSFLAGTEVGVSY